ncbi:MAG TPA: hypothetical protein VIX81_07260, partial [Gammaproteobacteria bacterium]
ETCRELGLLHEQLGEAEAAAACYRDAARLAAEAANRRTVGERPPAAAQLASREVEPTEILHGAAGSRAG